MADSLERQLSCWMYKREELSLDSKHPCKTQAWCSAGDLKTGRSLRLIAGQSSQIGKVEVQFETVSKKWGATEEDVWCCSLSSNMHLHLHTLAQM